MLQIEKIRVGLSEGLYQSLIDDIIFMKMLKKDGTPNINKYMNIFFKAYAPIYQKDTENKKEIILKYLNKYYHSSNNEKISIDITRSINYSDLRFAFLNKHNLIYITFNISEENLSLLERIISNSVDENSYSGIIRNMLKEYLNYSAEMRQIILNYDSANKIMYAIRCKKQICFNTTTMRNLIASPISFCHHNGNMINYILLNKITSHSKNIVSKFHFYNLSELSNVYILNNPIEYPNDETLEIINRIKRNSPAFLYNPNEKEILVEMTSDAINEFEANSNNRPYPVLIENNIYHFDCSYLQFQVFFNNILSEYTILEPKELIDYYIKNAESIIKKYK